MRKHDVAELIILVRTDLWGKITTLFLNVPISPRRNYSIKIKNIKLLFEKHPTHWARVKRLGTFGYLVVLLSADVVLSNIGCKETTVSSYQCFSLFCPVSLITM